MNIPALSAGDFAVALVALMAAAYELSLLFVRGRSHGHGWAATIGVAAATDCVLEGIQYWTLDPAIVRVLVQGESAALTLIAFSLVRFVEETTNRRFPAPRWLLRPLVGAILGLVLFTETIVPRGTIDLSLSWLNHPFVQSEPGPLTDVFYLALLTICGGATAQLALGAKTGIERRAYGVAMFLWFAAAALDTALTLGVVDSIPMFFLEYGFFVLSISLMVVDVHRYGALLVSSERARALSDQSLRMLLERLPLVVLVARGGRIVHANAAAGPILGFREVDDLLGQEVLGRLHAEERALMDEHMRRIIAAADAPHVWEARFLRADGDVVHTEVTAVPISFDERPALALLAVDMTEHRRMTARMMSADRMAAMGTLAAGVAHEINNPMTYVATNLELAHAMLPRMASWVRDASAGDVDRRSAKPLLVELEDTIRALGQARDGAGRVRSIVRDLTLLSRAERTPDAALDLPTLIRSALQIGQSETRYRARVETEWGPLPTVSGDAGRLGQVFLNLLVNAAQAIPPGNVSQNSIRIRTFTAPDGRGVVEIRDTGHGIPPEHLSRIFDPFFTTKPIGKGTGLGLSTVLGIVKSHGGHIAVDSTAGKGTTFRIYLPAVPDGTIPPLDVVSVAAPSSTEQQTLLVVDDEENVRTTLQLLLETQTYRVMTAAQGAEALALYLAHRSEIRLVLTDLMMPVMNGLALVRSLRAIDPGLPIIVSSGLTDPSALQELADEGITEILMKPCEASAVIGAVEKALQQAGGPSGGVMR